MVVRLRSWSEGDSPLLTAANTPAMTTFLGGPESPEDVVRRHEKYLRLHREGAARAFAILDEEEAVGWVGWWHTERDGSAAAEMGWFVVPEAQGRGVARAAVELAVADAAALLPAGRMLYAFPAVENAASNALCARAGFARLGTERVPFRGTVLHVAVWGRRLDAR